MEIKSVDIIHELKNRSELDKKLVHRLENIQKKAEELLADIPLAHKYFTPHDIKHKLRVLKNLNKIIPPDFLKELNEYEIFFLVAAVYLHDIGMAPLYEKYGMNLTDEIQNDIRKNHHIRSEEYIVLNYKKLFLKSESLNLDEHSAFVVGRICRGHRQELLEDRNLFMDDFDHHDNVIDIPLLSLLLRIADEIDLTSERSPEERRKSIPIEQKEALEHWERLRVVAGLNVAILPTTDEYYLTATAEKCPNIKIHTDLVNHENKINNELGRLPYFLRQYDKEVKINFPKFYKIKVVPHGYIYLPLKFSPSRNILELFVGDRLYDDPFVAVRELLKNCIDACNLLKERTKNNYFGDTPKIRVSVTNGDKLVISDNGIGMDDYDLEHYLTRVRESYYKSKEFTSVAHNFNPVSELGIGFLSSCMLADKVEIHTKKKDRSYKVTIDKDSILGKDFLLVEPSSMGDRGTSVILHLREGYKNLDISSILSKYARHVKIPIHISKNDSDLRISTADINAEKESFKKFCFSSSYFIQTASDNSSNLQNHSFIDFVIETNEVNGLISLLGKKDPIHGWSPSNLSMKLSVFNKSSIMTVPEIKRSCFLSAEGIFINNLSLLPSWLSSDQIYSDFDIPSGRIDLDNSRNNIHQNSKLENIMATIEEKLLAEIRKLLTEIETSKKDANFKVEYINEFIWTYIRPTLIDSSINNLVREFFYFKCILENEIRMLKYDEIKASNKPCILLNVFGHEENILYSMLKTEGLGKDRVYILGTSRDYIYPNFIDGERSYILDLIKITEYDYLNEIIEKLNPTQSDLHTYLIGRKNPLNTTIKLCKFNNFQSDLFYEEFYKSLPLSLEHETVIYLNYDHKLVRLFCQVLKKLGHETKDAIARFINKILFNSLIPSERSSDLENILEKITSVKKIDIEEYLVTINNLRPRSLIFP